MSRSLWLALVLSWRCVCAQDALPPAGLPALVAGVKPSVVSLVAFDPDKALPGTGTGVLVAFDRVLTCRHVVKHADRAEVRFADGKYAHVTGLLAEDRDWDLVLLAIDPARPDLPTATISDRTPAEGETLVAIGGPLGLEWTISLGIVSALRRLDNGLILQHTCAISGGSSGGPLFDLNGKVVGLQTSMLTAGSDPVIQAGQALNFAVGTARATLLQAGPARPLAQARGDLPANWRPAVHAAVDQLALRPFSRGDYGGSLNYFNEAVRREPWVADNWFRLGICHEHLGSLTDAVRAYRQSVKLDPSAGMAWNNLGVVLVRRREYDAAAEALQTAVKLRPESALLWNNLADAHFRLRHWGDALGAADEGLRRDSKHIGLHYSRGQALLALGRKADALVEVAALEPLDKAEAAKLRRECDKVLD